MNWDAFKNRAQTNGKKRMPRRHRHAVELTATCACALLVTLSLVLPAFAAGASNDAQTESTTVAATTDNSSSSSSNENVSGGGTSQDGSASASVEKDESSSDESSSASDNASSSAAAAAKAAPLLAASNASNVTTLSGNSTLPSNGASGTYQLTDNVTQSYTSFISSDVTIDLNGHTLNYTGNQSLFHVQSGGKLTIVDSSNTASNNVVRTSTVDAKNDASSIGKTASIEWNGSAPSKLTYYVTKSDVNTNGVNTNGLGTTETCEKHEVTPGGVINATNSTGANSVIYMDGGELNLQGGMITMAHASEYSSTDGHIIDVNGGTFNMTGGYVCGGTFQTGRNSHDHGGGILVRSGSMELSGGVIAANSDGEGGGIYNSATLKISGGVVSGNEVPVSSYGGGISSVNGTLTVSDGFITNNVMSKYCNNDGWGDHGGGGIAARGTAGTLSITGGYITGNKSQEAGGGVYAGANNAGLKSFTIFGGIIASNASEQSEGGGVRVSQGTKAVFNSTNGKTFITNNACNSTFDWGGGGVFVQAGDDKTHVANGNLIVENALITDNTAGGYGGGVAACPTGETVVTHTQGAAIYDNHDARSSDNANMSSGGHDKDMDSTVAYKDTTFRNNGHADYFLVRSKGNSSYISVITGRMLGDGAANWSGSVDGVKTDIDPNSGAEATYMVGLTAKPDQAAKTAAIGAATLIISGNYSHNHGGGIMTNGGVTLGHVENVDIYPGLKLNAKKALTQDVKDASSQLTKDEYTFVLLSPDSSTSAAPYWNEDGTLNYGGCSEAARTTNAKSGAIQFNVSSQYSQAGKYRYYVAEIPNSSDTDTRTKAYDKTIYRIDAQVAESSSTTLLKIKFTHYTVSSLTVTPITNGKDGSSYTPSITTNDGIVDFTLTKDGNSNDAAFTNALKPYSTSGSFTPSVKKHVDGGEVKEFTFELYSADGYKDGKWDSSKVIDTKTTTKSDGSYATVTFDTINYTNLGVNDLDTKARGGKATYTYYIREKPGSDNGYSYDGGYYKVVVTAKDTPAADNFSGTLKTTATYTYYDKDGKAASTSTTDPTFNNKYATSLPSAGQAGIALAYVAGAAALAYGIVRLYKTRSDSRKGGDR
ncbi:Spy0128 family protein [Parafannyhessea umbonata]|nr:FctA domain-containing protein [Parafannyhessea umbonata]